MKRALWIGLLVAVMGGVWDGTAAEEPSAEEVEILRAVEELKFETGVVPIGDGLATLSLREGLKYLNPKDTNFVLTTLWGNPPQDEPSLGMIFPADANVLEGGSWAALITYSDDGHIKDDDAASINYDELLESMREGTAEANKERQKMGYGAVELVGWASPPHYDLDGKKLYWAKELHFGGEDVNTLNYNIRILGREGVLNLNAIASMEELRLIEKATPELLSAVSFNEGHRYADFNESTDRKAAYGLAALVAGGVAAKAGFFKAIWLGILAFKKVIIVGVIAVIGLVKKFIFGKSPAK